MFNQWVIPPLDLRLQPDDVHVWRAPLVVPESVLEQLNQLLSERETTRATSFRFAEDRGRWIVAHGVLRILLSRYLCLDPLLLHFDFTTYGKPFLAFPVLNTPLQFTLAHSREHALYAFTYSRQVGIDVSCQSGEPTVLLQSREILMKSGAGRFENLPRGTRMQQLSL